MNVFSCWSLDFKCIWNILHLYTHSSFHNYWYRYHLCACVISYLYWMFAFPSEPTCFVIFLLLKVGLSTYKISISICCIAASVGLNSHSLSVKLLISSMNLNKRPVGYWILGCRLFPFLILNVLCQPFLVTKFLLKIQLITLWGFPCMLFMVPPPLFLKYYLFIFLSIWYCESWYVPPWFYPICYFLYLVNLVTVYFSMMQIC